MLGLSAYSYSFKDLGVENGGRLIFDAKGNVNPTPIYPSDQTRQHDGAYSIGNNLLGIEHNAMQSTAILDGHLPVPIETLNGNPSYAFAVNQSGTYVGTSNNFNLGTYTYGTAFTYTLDGSGPHVLPLPYSVGPSAALGINEAGLIVGVAMDDGSIAGPAGSRAFLSDGRTSWDLNTLIAPSGHFLLTSASDINDLGQIVGEAYDTRNGSRHFFLLTPSAVPEPSSILMISLGISAYGLRRWMGRRPA